MLKYETNLFDILKLAHKESMNQSNTSTKHHIRYDVKLKNIVTGKTIEFEYQCNPSHAKPNLKDCLYCYVMDAMAFEYCGDDIQYFADEFGYTKVKETICAFNGCKKAYNDIIEFCGESVYEWLKSYYENY